ncbi:hypothetical protein LSH36_120g15020 [Paralvinella palmiformis]|uniref:GPI inositol-deacylase n=1 Tax=Paralvinella palmiformis TaxID=53620 RepID=A0AAD9JY08_9ANNE|nr:hypothetical protein LSH36_120g15020 [Paralvinella palmiformis]
MYSQERRMERYRNIYTWKIVLLRVELDSDIQSKFPRYGLYFYGEGEYARKAKKTNFRLSGVPVLFIPGNAGSYRQVRSLGSVALKKAEDGKTDVHFNYFSLDFDEEFSALYGQLLYDEAEFTHECIKKILSLYKGAASPPKSVVLVGHSMGGMVARSLFMLADFKPELVNTIITQATPHKMPAINIDPLVEKFYDEVNMFWKAKENTTVSDVTVFSTGGGYRDVLVRSQLTSLNGIVRRDRSVSSNTMSVPGAWVSTDHLCHVWCKQIVLATQRALFDVIDRSTKQVAISPFYRVAVFLHHFIKNPGDKRFKGAYDKTVYLDKTISWEIRKKLSWKLWAKNLPKVRYSVTEIPVPLVPVQYAEPEYGYVAISNINNDKWLGVCSLKEKVLPSLPGGKKKKNNLKQCTQVTNQAQYADQLPPIYSDKKVEVYSELYKLAERHLVYNTTGMFDFMMGFPHTIGDVHVVINKTAPSAIFYNISLNDLDIPLQAYTAHLTTLGCKEDPPASSSGAVLKLHIPWAHEHTYSFIRSDKNGSIALKLITPRPVNVLARAQLHLFLLPTCTYRLSITIGLEGAHRTGFSSFMDGNFHWDSRYSTALQSFRLSFIV